MVSTQLASNLNQHVLPSHGAANVAADWEDLGVMSHSLGADYLVQMLQDNKTFAKASTKLYTRSILLLIWYGMKLVLCIS